MSALYLTKDLLFSSRVTSAAKALSLELTVVTSPEGLVQRVASGGVHLILLEFAMPDLNLLELVPRLREASPTPVNIIAFGPHVNVSGLAAASQAGCNAVYTRGQFNQQMDEILRKHGCTT